VYPTDGHRSRDRPERCRLSFLARSLAAAYAADEELAGAELSNAAYADMARRVASAAVAEGDFKTAAAMHIELASRDTSGRFARACGPLDAFGRCGEPYHSADCGTAIDSAAARGSAEQDAWNDSIALRHTAMILDGIAYENAGTGARWRPGRRHGQYS